MRKPLLIANWKMNGNPLLVEQWISTVSQYAAESTAELVLCAPTLYIAQVASLARGSKLAWGAQDVSDQEQGAYTGQIAASMLKEFACKYVIVGHSERRHYNHETDELIAAKFSRAQQSGLIPVLCVGETLAQYQAGQTQAVVHQQLNSVLKQVGVNAMAQAVIAYEPVWAIGTGLAATPQQAEAVHVQIREQIAREDDKVATQLQILYGGSVKPENAADLFMQSNIDGGLVGGASLDADAFIKISHGW